jgi:hypothetical protein
MVLVVSGLPTGREKKDVVSFVAVKAKTPALTVGFDRACTEM